jgi:NAD(P)-dependent dehydrogenase (short-subunit alcohol dehydrogenase family)
LRPVLDRQAAQSQFHCAIQFGGTGSIRRRMGQPEEIGKAAVFLASDDASFVAGAELLVDGGLAQV